MMNKIAISIIVPCRNEERFIADCIDSVLSFENINDYIWELFLIDGMSDDNTREIIEQYTKKYAQIRLIENRNIIQSSALNIGIKLSKGQYIMRLDAHSKYPKNYLKLLLDTALRTDAHNTGGIIITQPYNNSYSASLVQAISTHKFGVGNSGFRVGMKEGESDTVPFGFFKKEIFEKIGYFDERLVRCQDYEFNCRIKKVGGKIWLNPNIQCEYFNQPNIIKFLKKQFLKEAPYNPYMWYLAPYTFNIRHAITIFFVLGIIGGVLLSFFNYWIKVVFLSVLFLYFLLATISAVQQSIKFKKWQHTLFLPFCFFLFHFVHGLGGIFGIIHLIFGIAPVQKKLLPWKGSSLKKIKIKFLSPLN